MVQQSLTTKIRYQEHQQRLETKCSNPSGGYTQLCESKHLVKKTFRCRDCEGCYNHRVRRIKSDAYKRLAQSDLHDTEVVLWTAGTNWSYTESNYAKLRRAFTLFRKFLRKQSDTKINIYFRVYELGSKGGKLHVHFVSDVHAIDWYKAKAVWEKYLVELGHSNVSTNFNYKRVKRCKLCNKHRDYQQLFCSNCGQTKTEIVGAKPAVLYLIKYLSKEYQVTNNGETLSREYYWGKPLWYKENLENTSVQYSLDGGQNGKELYSKPNGQKREITYIHYPTLGFDNVTHEETWMDQEVTCAYVGNNDKRCGDNVVIKSMEFEKEIFGRLVSLFGLDDAKAILNTFYNIDE